MNLSEQKITNRIEIPSLNLSKEEVLMTGVNVDTGISMKMGDICDRWSILRMKVRFSEDFRFEFERYNKVVTSFLDLKECLPHLADLIEANAKIWLLEAAIRKEFKDDISSQDELSCGQIGRRVLEIRPYNKRRLQAKDAIDAFYGGVPDLKFFGDEK